MSVVSIKDQFLSAIHEFSLKFYLILLKDPD